MKYVNLSDCPPNSVVWFSWNAQRTKMKARIELEPAADGKHYTRVSASLTTDRDWPAMLAATRRQGWRLKKWGCVNFCDWLIFELVPTLKAARA